MTADYDLFAYFSLQDLWLRPSNRDSEGLTTLRLGVRGFKSENGKNLDFLGLFGFFQDFWIFWIFFRIFLDFWHRFFGVYEKFFE